MRTFHWLLLASLSLFLTSIVAAQQPASKGAAASQATPKPLTATRPTLRPVATIQDLMNALVDPSSDVVFNAVATTVSASGVEDKVPRNDNEWAVVRNHTLTLIEAGNLLMMGGRRVASAASTAAAAALNPEEAAAIQLSPEQIERRLAADRASWTKLAKALLDAGTTALKAVEAKDPEALLAAGDSIEMACENCHKRYWYPEEKTKPEEKKKP